MKTVNVENIEKRIDWINSILKNDSFKKYTLPAQLKALRFERDCLSKLLGLMENKNEFPNPVDGDVQELIEYRKALANDLTAYIARPLDNPMSRGQWMDVAKIALEALTTPPAQLLRPVELPDCVDDLHGVGPVMSADAVVQALRQQGYEVKS